jgi:dTDP-4-amino-4,6-dideoxygalactose transaminase
MKIPFVDLTAQYLSIRPAIDEAIASVIRDTAFIGTGENRYVRAFEEQFAEWSGAAHCIGCANGTDAIEILLQAAGIGAGHEVIVPAHSWISTAEAVTAIGARPVFVDTRPDTYTIDPELIEARITPRTKAIIPVHLYGLPADMDPILAIARKHGLRVIEDCAQAVGATYKGRRIGTMGDAASFSFFPGKNLGAYGDAGGMITSDAELAKLARMIGQHGQLAKHEHVREGRNSRLDGMQAAILSAKLPHLRQWTSQRQAHAAQYGRLLADAPVQLPVTPEGSVHVYHLYVVQSANRDDLQRTLTDAGIGCAVHYPRSLPSLPAYTAQGWRGEDFPVATSAAGRILSLPMYPEMTDRILRDVAGVVQSVVTAERA